MLLLLAATYLLGEAWVVAGWEGRPYRWTVDAISALGVPEAQHWAGEESRSTRHAAMNAIFVGSGVRVLLAGAVLAPFVPRPGRWVVLPLVMAYACGLVIVGFFPSAMSGLRVTMHGVGALLAIVGGCFLLLAIAVALARRHPFLAALTGAFAATAFIGTWVAASGTDRFGLYERVAVDAVVVWQIVVGALVLATSRQTSVDVGHREVGVRQG